MSASSSEIGGVYSDKEQILVINSSNGTSHIYNLKKPKKSNEVPISKLATHGKDNQQRVIMLMPKTRFKYKSVM